MKNEQPKFNPYFTQAKKTKSYKFKLNEFRALIKTKSFLRDKARLREKHPKIIGDIYYSLDEENQDAWNDATALATKYGFGEFAWCMPFAEFIFSDRIVEPIISVENAHSVSAIDIKEVLSDPEHYSKMFDRSHPIIIRIAPNASRRMIVDYVEKMYTPVIKPMQDAYKKRRVVKRFNSRNPIIEKRNDFIYDNRHKSAPELMSLVMEKFGGDITPDMSGISKIISLEAERRKKL